VQDSLTEILGSLDRVSGELRAGAHNDSIAQVAEVPSVEATAQERLATVIVTVRGGFQEAWSRRDEMGIASYEALAAVTPPSRKGRAPLSYRKIDGDYPVERITCTHCRIRPGLGPCPRCTGVGVLLVQQPGSDNSNVVDCPDCEDGFATCTVCGGSTKSVVATVRYVNVKPFETNHVIPCVCRDAFVRAYPDTVEPPEGLAYDLESPSGQSAYRGATASAEREFHGYVFGDSVKQARAFVHRVRSAPGFLIDTLRTYAFPFVLATFVSKTGTHRAVFFVNAAGDPTSSLL
jgi:hypothetical protein